LEQDLFPVASVPSQSGSRSKLPLFSLSLMPFAGKKEKIRKKEKKDAKKTGAPPV
jgi:hypothetical protein